MTVFSSNGVANMGEHAKWGGDSTGGTYTVSAACENLPVAVSGGKSRCDSPEGAGGIPADSACGNHPVAYHPQQPRYRTNGELLDDLHRRGFIDARTDAARQLLERVNDRHLMPYVSAAEKSGEKPTLQAVHDLLTLDRRFQAVVFKYIGIFEMQLRASYSDAMAKAYGAFAAGSRHPRRLEGIANLRGCAEHVRKSPARLLAGRLRGAMVNGRALGRARLKG